MGLLTTTQYLVDHSIHTYTHLEDVHYGAIGRSNKDRSVVVDVDDGDLEAGRAPESRPTMICSHYSQIKPLKTVQETQ